MFNSSVDGILKAVTKAITALESVSEKEKAVAESKGYKANALLAESGMHRDEAERARKLAEKFTDLIKV